MSEAKIMEMLEDRFDKLENILEEQNIKLFNINKKLMEHRYQLKEIEFAVKIVHEKTVRLSLDQSEIDMKIDQLKNLMTEQKEKNINNI